LVKSPGDFDPNLCCFESTWCFHMVWDEACCNLSNNVWVERAGNTWRNGSERLEEKLAMQIYHMVNQAVHVKAIFKSF
jgi:hypothetical protein